MHFGLENPHLLKFILSSVLDVSERFVIGDKYEDFGKLLSVFSLSLGSLKSIRNIIKINIILKTITKFNR